MANDWRIGLVNEYPEFFREVDGFPSVGDGWRDLLGRALARIRRDLAEEPPGARLEIDQIAPKFGMLRLSFTGRPLSHPARMAVQRAIDLAEARSACTCERCGEDGRLHVRNGWYLTCCGEHSEGVEVAVRPGWRHLRILQTIEKGKWVVTSCLRYDRALDRFFDVPLPAEHE